MLKEGIPYTYQKDESYPPKKIISFTFGGRVEKLQSE
jgi:hypothetical protein